MEKFSIIVPVYNSEKYLGRCLDSILRQKYTNFEVIVVDDGSNDGSTKIIEEYAKKDFRIHYFRKKNEGPAIARNFGMKLSRGEYICFIDSDDELLPNYFLEVEEALKKLNLDILEINAFYQNENCKTKIKYQELDFSKEIMSGPDYLSNYLREDNYFNVVPWTKIVKKQFISENNLYFENTYAEDELWARKIFAFASRVMFLDMCLYVQHRRSNSQSKRKYMIKNVKEQKEICYKLENIYRRKINNSLQLNVLLNELSHNFIAISLLNKEVKVTLKDKIFALRNAKGLINIFNALIFFISPNLRNIVKGMIIKK